MQEVLTSSYIYLHTYWYMQAHMDGHLCFHAHTHAYNKHNNDDDANDFILINYNIKLQTIHMQMNWIVQIQK